MSRAKSKYDEHISPTSMKIHSRIVSHIVHRTHCGSKMHPNVPVWYLCHSHWKPHVQFIMCFSRDNYVKLSAGTGKCQEKLESQGLSDIRISLAHPDLLDMLINRILDIKKALKK